MSARRAERGLRLRVEVGGRPDPFLLPAAISARLRERPFPAGPEAVVAAAVARAVARRKEERCR